MQLPSCLSHIFLDQDAVLDGVIGTALGIHWLFLHLAEKTDIEGLWFLLII